MATKTVKKRWILLGVLIIALAGYYGLKPFSGAAPQGMPDFAMPVEVASVSSEPLNVTIESVGTLRANESVILRPEATGRIVEIMFTEGAPLKKGDPLFKMDDRIVAAELKQAEANLRLAQLDYNRFAKLARTGAATRRLVEQSQANLGVAQANVELARTKLDYTTIRAPFDGVVGLRKVSPGDYVTLGQEMANYVSYDPMKVDFTIPETRASVLQVGQKIAISVEAIPGSSFEGVVFALDPQVDVSGRAVALRANVPNPEAKLKPGYFARVSLEVSRNENALTLPEGAVVPQGDKQFVYKVSAENTVSMVPVTVGQRMAGKVEITSGLSAGDIVVTSGQIKLREGAKVQFGNAQGKPPQAAGQSAPEDSVEKD